MSGFVRALAFVVRPDIEGGLSNHPKDPGKLTYVGVTQAAYDKWLKLEGQPSRSVADISNAEIAAVYHRLYWTAGKCDALPWPLSLVHFDSMVQHGEAPKLLQRALGVTEDGIIGPKTLAAAQGDGLTLAHDLLWVRLEYYTGLKALWPTFGRGWVARMCKLRKAVGA